MEDDDEFGDLYTDVLTPFVNSSSLPIQNAVSIDADRKEIVSEAPSLKRLDLGKSDLKLDESKWKARVLDGESEERKFEDPNLIDESQIDVIEGGEDEEVRDVGDPVIPGLSIGGSEKAVNGNDEGFGEEDDWDSDSDDGLQIVLNDNNDEMELGGLGGEGDDAEDDNLVIVGDGDGNQVEEQDLGEDGGVGQGGEGERKEGGEGERKVNGAVQPPKPGYGYHNQFHSQFKYVRPGAPPIPGAAPLAPGVSPGQIRPPLSIGPTPGRGRGDWRPAGLKNTPPMQKGFHAGYGAPVWANNTPGHGFGRGLDFTLPSHKTIFEVDIDTFEEKPWGLVGVDISDFFNFGLNEDSWKDYCKQLEQLRLEATMQSKIRVYESGRTDQDYDPDMPPELAAAAGIHDIPADNTNLEKAEVGHSDISMASLRARPQFPPGRPIQVETGFGERLPSIDTRPPRMRDADAIIEIVLQGSADDDSVNGNDIAKLTEDPSREELGPDVEENEENNSQEDAVIFDSAPQSYKDRKKEVAGRKAPPNKAVRGRMIRDENSPIMLGAPVQKPSSSREKTPINPGVHRDERRRKGRASERSPSKTRSGSTTDKRRHGNQKDESAETIDEKNSPCFSSSHNGGVTEDQYFEENNEQLDGRFEMDRIDSDLNMTETHLDETSTQSIKKQKLNSQVEQPHLEEVDGREDSKAARSSENSKAISGNSRDYQNLPDGAEDEVAQHGMSTRMGTKRKLNEDEYRFRSKVHKERQDMDRHQMVNKGREGPYSRKNWDSNAAHHSHLKSDVVDRRKDSDNSDGGWHRKDEESHGRRARMEDPRKRDRGDDMGPRHHSKVREIDRNDLDQYQLKKQLDNGRGYHDKDMGSRDRDRDDNVKTRNDSLDDLHSKRRKDDVHSKRDRGEKEELLHVHRENTNRRKRERDDVVEQRKKDEIVRIRNDDQQSLRHKDEIWFSRDRADRPRERDDWQRLKQSHEETLSKREREDVRGMKTVRTVEEKSWASHSRVKDELKGSDREYHLKDSGRHIELLKRRDRVETDGLSRHRGSEDVYSRANQPNNDERRSRQERPIARSDRVINASDHHKMPEKKHKEYPRKSKESAGELNSAVPSRRNQEHNSQISERVRLRGMIDHVSGDQGIPMTRQSSKKRKEDASSDDEQHDSTRGRSKLERWTSHKERDFNAGTQLSPLNVKEIDNHKAGALAANTVPDVSSKTVETGQNSHTLANETDAGDQLNKDGEAKPKEDKHLDTVAKLKKRSERFKLPMPSEKEPVAVKKTDNEQPPPDQTESRTDLEIKHERPARKRRWTGN